MWQAACRKWRGVLSQLQHVSVAAIQGALGGRAVAAFVLGPHRVDDEPGGQMKSFGQFGFTCPATWEQWGTQTSQKRISCVKTLAGEGQWAESNWFSNAEKLTSCTMGWLTQSKVVCTERQCWARDGLLRFKSRVHHVPAGPRWAGAWPLHASIFYSMGPLHRITRVPVCKVRTCISCNCCYCWSLERLKNRGFSALLKAMMGSGTKKRKLSSICDSQSSNNASPSQHRKVMASSPPAAGRFTLCRCRARQFVNSRTPGTTEKRRFKV